MKKALALLLFAALASFLFRPATEPLPNAPTVVVADDEFDAAGEAELTRAFERRISNLQVQASGRIIKRLPDDTRGHRHQKFLVQLRSGLVLLIAHNIDLAPRLSHVAEGDILRFNGEYEWNAQGGVVHWTHHDPKGRHVGGWLKHQGRTYQ